MLRDALDFPTSGDRGAKAVLVGGVLLLLSGLFVLSINVLFLFILLGVALLCQLLIRGYYVRVLRRTAANANADAPPFDDWGSLVVDGVKAGLVALAYFLPALILAAIAIGGGLSLDTVGNPSAAVGALRTLTGLSILFLLLYLVGIAYVLPAAVTNFAYRDRLGAAFDLRTVLRGAVSEDYAVAWVLSVVLQSILLPLAFVLGFVLVGFFVWFYTMVAVRSLYGRGFGAALGLEPLPETEPRGGPAVTTPAATPSTDGDVSVAATRRVEENEWTGGRRAGDRTTAGGDAPDAATEQTRPHASHTSDGSGAAGGGDPVGDDDGNADGEHGGFETESDDSNGASG